MNRGMWGEPWATGRLAVGLIVAVTGCSSGAPSRSDPSAAHVLCERPVAAAGCVAEGFSGCDDGVSADFAAAGILASFEAVPPYGEPGAPCPGRYVYEVPTEGASTGPDSAPGWARPLWVRTVWDITEIDTREECEQIAIVAAIQREVDPGTWEDWDSFRVVGSWTSACETVFCGGGRLPDGTLNQIVGAPQTWVAIGDSRRVRVAISAHDAGCTQRTLLLGVSGTL